MVRVLILAATASVALSIAHAADFEGVSMPDARVVDGTQMRLNGWASHVRREVRRLIAER